MRYVVTSKEMKQADQTTSEFFGLDSAILMERAAMSVVAQVEEFRKTRSMQCTQCHVFCMAGSGGNGGDGVAIARMLHLQGYRVALLTLREKERCGALTAKQIDIAKKYGVPFVQELPQEEFDVYIDAMLGIGVERVVSEEYTKILQEVNCREGYKIAVDIPSGIHTDTGHIMGCAFRADKTVTFGFVKRGLLLFPGAEYAGDVVLADIGITDHSFLGKYPLLFSLEENDIREGIMPRREDGNKGTFGKVLVIAGSPCMAGAAVFAAKSALRLGAGMVKVLTERSNREILQIGVPEAILTVYDNITSDEEYDILLEQVWQNLAWADSCIIGPGLSQTETAKTLLESVVSYMIDQDPGQKHCKRFVFDADALNLLAKDQKLQEKLEKQQDCEVIYTPHLMEFSRLSGIAVSELKTDLVGSVLHFAQEKRGIYVCKDARTVVCYNQKAILNRTGNSALATAGSGDCLAGIIGSFLAQGYEADKAAAFGVYVHGLAGENAGDRLGKAATMASDLVDSIGIVMNGFE